MKIVSIKQNKDTQYFFVLHPRKTLFVFKQWNIVYLVCLLNPISQGVSIPSHARGYLITPLENPGRSDFRPLVALYKLDLFKNWVHIQKFGNKYKKLSKISRFQNFEKLRFRLTLTHRNSHNSLKFWDRELIFRI